eukprot:jgi/Chrpa1/6358/Chrysochromulina_OHIO_Genome00002437-RA
MPRLAPPWRVLAVLLKCAAGPGGFKPLQLAPLRMLQLLFVAHELLQLLFVAQPAALASAAAPSACAAHATAVHQHGRAVIGTRRLFCGAAAVVGRGARGRK